MHYVILGAGPSGVTAAETLRKADKTSDITIIGGEVEPPYSRMAIPYLLSKDIEERGTYLRQTDGHYDAKAIRYVQGRAGGIDPKNKKVHLGDGNSVAYDKLLIATGASPIHPPIPGLYNEGVHNCWTLEDARAIAGTVSEGDPVVLMGAGFIGSIILEALVKMGVKLTVVEMGDRMVPRMMDENAGNMIKRWSESKGVNVVTSTRINEVSKTDGGLTVTLSNGSELDAKLLVVAAGVSPNTTFLVGSGVRADYGINIDEFMQTTTPDIYAAGDVAQGIDLSTGEPDVLAIQPVAVEHGRIAALNMAGQPTPHRGSLNMNVLDTLGLISSSFGAWMGVEGGETAYHIDDENYKYLRLQFKGDKLVGAQSVGMTDHVGIARGLIQTELDLGKWKAELMKSPSRLAEAYIANAQGL